MVEYLKPTAVVMNHSQAALRELKNQIASVVAFFPKFVSYEKLESLCHFERPTFQQSVFHHSMLIHIFFMSHAKIREQMLVPNLYVF